MLFDASVAYAPGEPRGIEGVSAYQQMDRVGRYDLAALKPPNLWIALAGLAAIAYLVHQHGGRKR
jgi:hypothetical protein